MFDNSYNNGTSSLENVRDDNDDNGNENALNSMEESYFKIKKIYIIILFF